MKLRTVACLAIGLALGSAGTVGTANAAVGVGFDIGGVSLGFSDGYWDNHHHWHHWAHRDDLARFRAAHADQYHDWRHDDRSHHM